MVLIQSLPIDLKGTFVMIYLCIVVYFIFNLTGELFFITDRGNGFWNLHKWVILSLFIPAKA